MNAQTTKQTIITLENSAVALAEQIALMRRLGDDECVAILADKYREATRKLAEARAAR
jgi:hypothetical protein